MKVVLNYSHITLVLVLFLASFGYYLVRDVTDQCAFLYYYEPLRGCGPPPPPCRSQINLIITEDEKLFYYAGDDMTVSCVPISANNVHNNEAPELFLGEIAPDELKSFFRSKNSRLIQQNFELQANSSMMGDSVYNRQLNLLKKRSVQLSIKPMPCVRYGTVVRVMDEAEMALISKYYLSELSLQEIKATAQISGQ